MQVRYIIRTYVYEYFKRFSFPFDYFDFLLRDAG